MLKKVTKRGKYLLRNNVVDRLENDAIISKIIFGMVYGRPYEGF